MSLSRKIPHLLFGADGNRRYAVREGISFEQSYALFAQVSAHVVEWCFEEDLCDEVSLWLIQEYNFERDPSEIIAFSHASIECIKLIANSSILQDKDVQIRFVGELPLFYERIKGSEETLSELLDKVKNRKGKRVNILFPHNGSKELMRAWQRCTYDKVDPSFTNLSQRWSIPPISVFVRTGQPYGFRLSDFFPGIEQARLLGTPLYPAELTKKILKEMLQKALDTNDRQGAPKL